MEMTFTFFYLIELCSLLPGWAVLLINILNKGLWGDKAIVSNQALSGHATEILSMKVYNK